VNSLKRTGQDWTGLDWTGLGLDGFLEVGRGLVGKRER